MSNCSAFADALNANYHATEQYIPGTGLSEYLESHGVLLSICMNLADPSDHSCQLPRQATHVAASWINAAIGPHVIPAGNLGVTLKPSDIRCIYPTDGGTDGRDDKGCGPPSWDPEQGSKGAKKIGIIGRFIERRMQIEYKNKVFGKETKWADISCGDYFSAEYMLRNAIAWQSDNNCGQYKAISSQSIFSYSDQMLEPVMGHAVCNVTAEGAHFGEDNFFVNVDPCSWQPEEWQTMVDFQTKLIGEYPSPYNWNEIVLGMPSDFQDIVTSVFYAVTPDMDDETKTILRAAAKEDARKLGGKPVLEADEATASFSCIQDEGNDVNEYSEPTDLLPKP